MVSSACRAGRCEVTACIAGTADCDGDPDSICETTTLVDNRHCGACGHACEADALCVSGRCASVAVRQRSPVTIERVSSTRPTLRWALSAGTTGARVELCDTYACDTIASAWEVAGDRLRVPTPLSGGIHYWRLYARRGARTDPTPGPTWAFSVPPHAVVQEGRIDLNGDGFADVVHANQLGTDAELGMPDPEAGIAYGTLNGLLPSTGMPDPRLSFHTVYALDGDYDCDGYGDFATYTAVSLGVAGPTSILSGQSLTLGATLAPLAFAHRDTLDFNGDGCIDFVLSPIIVSVPTARSRKARRCRATACGRTPTCSSNRSRRASVTAPTTTVTATTTTSPHRAIGPAIPRDTATRSTCWAGPTGYATCFVADRSAGVRAKGDASQLQTARAARAVIAASTSDERKKSAKRTSILFTVA